MKILRPFFEDKNAPRLPVAVSIGNFDGMHLGHAALIESMKAEAKRMGLLPCVLTFETHPKSFLSGGQGVARLTSDTLNRRLFESTGVERLILLPFDERIAMLTPEQFVGDILDELIGAKLVCCGENFRFGRGASGDASILQNLCSSRGIQTIVVSMLKIDGINVSSTYIRKLILQGDMEEAARFLGRRYSICAVVEFGQKLGRTIGLPTINQRFDCGQIIPATGVYASRTLIEDTWTPSVTNIGTRPTVKGGFINAETHIMGYEGELYGQEIEVEFIKRLRPEKKFESLDELKTQIESDIIMAQKTISGQK